MIRVSMRVLGREWVCGVAAGAETNFEPSGRRTRSSCPPELYLCPSRQVSDVLLSHSRSAKSGKVKTEWERPRLGARASLAKEARLLDRPTPPSLDGAPRRARSAPLNTRRGNPLARSHIIESRSPSVNTKPLSQPFKFRDQNALPTAALRQSRARARKQRPSTREIERGKRARPPLRPFPPSLGHRSIHGVHP